MSAVATKPTTDLLGQAKKQFQAIGKKWQELRTETGTFLLEQEGQLSRPVFMLLQQWIKDNYNINLEEQRTCIRVAKGEIDEEVAAVLSPSVASKMPTDRVPKPNQKFTIYSPDTGTPVTKTVKEMTGSERRHCITKQGVVTIDQESKPEESRPFRCSVATKWEVDGDSLLIFVGSEKLRVRVKITKSLKDAIAEA